MIHVQEEAAGLRNLSQRRRRRRRRLGHDDDGTAPLLLMAPPHPSSPHQLPRPYLLLLPWGCGGWARGNGGDYRRTCFSLPWQAQRGVVNCKSNVLSNRASNGTGCQAERPERSSSCTTKRKTPKTWCWLGILIARTLTGGHPGCPPLHVPSGNTRRRPSQHQGASANAQSLTLGLRETSTPWPRR